MIQLYREYFPYESTQHEFRILLIDDDAVFNAIMEEVAQESGCHLEYVCSPFEIEYVTTDDFDLILLDFQLGSTNGLQIAPALNENFPGTPIILISSNADISEMDATLPEIYEFLPKSKSPYEILSQSLELINQLNFKN